MKIILHLESGIERSISVRSLQDVQLEIPGREDTVPGIEIVTYGVGTFQLPMTNIREIKVETRA